MGIANRNAVLRGAKTERKENTEIQNMAHLKKKKTPSSYKSNNSHHSIKSPFQRDFCLESPRQKEKTSKQNNYSKEIEV